MKQIKVILALVLVGGSRGEYGKDGQSARAWSCQSEVRLGEDEVPDDPRVLRTRYRMKILISFFVLGAQVH